MANDFKRGIRIYLETSDYNKGIDEMVKHTQTLETKYKELTDETKKMTEAGIKSGKAWDDNQKQLKAYEKAIVKSQKSEEDYRAKLAQTEKVLNNLSGVSYNELIKVQKQLQRELKDTAKDTDLYKTKLTQLERVNHQVANSQQEMNSKIGAGAKGIRGFIDNMSNMPGVLGYVGSSLQGVGAAFKTFIANPAMIALTAIAAIGMGIVALVKNSMQFSTAISQLSAITGASGEDLIKLKEKAKDLGAQYGKSAVEIVEAMKMVGSAKPELLANIDALSAVTESVLVLSKASGMDLAETTKSLTSIMNQFGLGAEEANRTINVLAAGSKYGAVEVDYLGESIVKVGTIAKSAGLSLEQTVSVMELFGEKGIKAEIAGTGFKSILGKLQADTRNYTNGLFDLNKAIDNNKNISNDNLQLQKEFGAEFYGLAGILLQNKDRFYELQTQVTNTQTAFEQFRIANDNLEGDVSKLSGTWDRFLLSIEDGDGIFAKAARYVVKFFTGLLSDITLFGQDAGRVIDFIKDSFQILGMQIGAVGTTIGESFTLLSKIARKAVKGDFKDISSSFDEFKKNVKDAWSPERWQGIVERQRAMKNLEKATRDQAKAEKEAAAAKKKLKAYGGTGGTGGTGSTETEDEKKKKAAEKAAQDSLKKLEDRYRKELEVKQIAYNQDMFLLLEQRRKGEITEDELNKRSLELNIQFLEAKKAINIKYGKDVSEIDLEISKQRLKSQQDADALIIKTTKDLQDAGIAALESANLTKQSMLQDALNKQVITEKEYNTEIKKLAVELLAAKVALAEASVKALETGNFSDNAVKEDAIAKAKSELASLKGMLVKAEGDVAKDVAGEVEDNIIPIAERMEGIFGQSFSNIGNLFSTFSKSFLDEAGHLTTENLKTFEDWANAIGATIQGALSVAQQVSDEYFANQAAGIEADKQTALSANEEKFQKGIISQEEYENQKGSINQKYAQKELDLKKKQSSADTVLKVAQAVAAGGLAIVQAFAQLGPIGGAIAAFMIGGVTALQVGTILKQNAAIQATTLDSSASGGGETKSGARVAVPQAADGRWDVVGQDDGRTYRNVPYRGVARTGIVTTPTLVGEVGDELIVDNPTLRNIRMNAPGVLSTIKRMRVNQRAEGNYSNVNGSDGGAATGQDMSGLYAALLAMIDRNTALLGFLAEHGVDTILVIDEYEKMKTLRDKAKAKGSL